jgi:hypothetical protein
MLPSPALEVPPAIPARSTTIVRNPARAAKYAHEAPTMPAPMITTSAAMP